MTTEDSNTMVTEDTITLTTEGEETTLFLHNTQTFIHSNITTGGLKPIEEDDLTTGVDTTLRQDGLSLLPHDFPICE